jgi:4'-phosphopantetheinyl transferase
MIERWPLPPAAVHIWLFDPAALAADSVAAAAASLLSPAERQRWQRLLFERDRLIFLATRALARTILAGYAGVPARQLEFVVNDYGKPELAQSAATPQLRFNLSNTEALAAAAVTWNRDIGVDVERLREPPLEITSRVFTPVEVEALRGAGAADLHERFFALWTLKEAVIKARGNGLSLALDTFAVSVDPPRLLPYGSAAGDCEDWALITAAPTAVHRLGLCVAASDSHPVIETRWLPPDTVVAAAG